MTGQELETMLIEILLRSMERNEFPDHDAMTYHEAGLAGNGVVLTFLGDEGDHNYGLAIHADV